MKDYVAVPSYLYPDPSFSPIVKNMIKEELEVQGTPASIFRHTQCGNGPQ